MAVKLTSAARLLSTTAASAPNTILSSASTCRGFAGAPNGVSPQFARSSCDTMSGSDRLCVHTGGNQVNGGYRCGDNMGLNGDWYWVRWWNQAAAELQRRSGAAFVGAARSACEAHWRACGVDPGVSLSSSSP